MFDGLAVPFGVVAVHACRVEHIPLLPALGTAAGARRAFTRRMQDHLVGAAEGADFPIKSPELLVAHHPVLLGHGVLPNYAESRILFVYLFLLFYSALETYKITLACHSRLRRFPLTRRL